MSQATPGSANDGQNQRLVIGPASGRRRSTGLEVRPRVLPERLPRRRQRVDRHALLEVGLRTTVEARLAGMYPSATSLFGLIDVSGGM